MGSYRSLFELVVEHSYFNGGKCTCLNFVPSEKTRRIINNIGLVIKKTESGIGIVYDKSRMEALLAYVEDETEPLCFEFKAYAVDPQFTSYTDVCYGNTDGSVLYFNNLMGVDIFNEHIRLHTTEYVSTINSKNIESPDVKDILSQKDRLIPPVFVVAIYAKGEVGSIFSEQYEIAEKKYFLRFEARETVWKYYLFGSMARENAYIHDQNGDIEFDFIGETTLSDTRPALAFKSKVAMPLRQKQDFRFQLKERGPGGDRVLIKRLPVANVSQFGKEVVSEQGIVVSEIFINC